MPAAIFVTAVMAAFVVIHWRGLEIAKREEIARKDRRDAGVRVARGFLRFYLALFVAAAAWLVYDLATGVSLRR